jgi:di/tricarboxylate transporter
LAPGSAVEIAFVLAVLALAAVGFSLERVSVDVVALAVLVALLVGGILTPAEALAGFASEAVVVIGGLFVLTAGLRASGAVDVLTRRCWRWWP